jgi:hypothetical protein
MVSDQAQALALRLLASYPGVPATKMAVAALAESLDRMGLDIAEAVVERARTELVRVPSVAQLYEVAHEIRQETVVHERPSLPAGDEATALEMPQEARDAIARLREKWSGNDLERDVVAEDAEWQRVKTATLARLRMHGTCLGTDKPPVQVDGMLVCPVCRVEVART